MAARATLVIRAAHPVLVSPVVSTVRASGPLNKAAFRSSVGRSVKGFRVSTPCRQCAPSFRSFKAMQIRAQSTATEKERMTSDDIIERIKYDHKALEESFDNYKKAHKQGDDMEARKWFNQFVWEISLHSVSEELVMYPMLATCGDKGQQLADQSRQDHHKVKEMLAELQITMDMGEFDHKMNAMMKALKDHIKLEEREDLPLLAEYQDMSARENAGRVFQLGKNLVPTHPHPAVPEKPAALEAALGLFATPIDKLRDVFTPFPSTSEKKRSVN